MKRLIYFMLLAVFLTTSCLPVYADGIGDNQRSDYPGVIDYRQHDIGLTPDHEKPRAGFSLQIKDPFGNLLTDTIDSGNIDGRKSIVSEQDSPAINANIGDSIIINDLSSPGSGSKITQYDIQYRFTPEGEKRENYELTYHIVSSFNEVKGIVEKIKLDKPGTYEFYMEVADNASCLPGATNWSANGNLRVINTSNPNFPKGIFWYFTEAVVEVSAGSPDFYPTPEGSTEWQESYKDCAKTYYYEPGDAEKTFSVNLYNQGEKAITDFRAVWYGQGDDSVKGWQGSNPAWQADDLIELDKGESETFEITVDLTQMPADAEGKLVFLCNVNGKTPASEINQENNMMVVKVAPRGVDFAITGSFIEGNIIELPLDENFKRISVAEFRVYRKDSGNELVDAEVTISGPAGIEKETISLYGGEEDYVYYDIESNQVGTHTVHAEVWPVVTDLNPNDNVTELSVTYKRPKAPERSDGDTNIRGGLTG